MRIIFLPEGWTIAICFILWPVLQVGAALFCLIIPDSFFSQHSALFRTYGWEKGGRIYKTLFRASRWKHLLPDGGAVWKKHGFKKKKLDSFSEENLKRFITESARGELTHWLAIFPFWVFWLFTPPPVPLIMFIYALAINLPCIIVQRYNRPRVLHLLQRKEKRFKNYVKKIP